MTASKEMIEVKGGDVEIAIAAGLVQLGLPRQAVTIEIVEEGRRGILGLGSREAVVRLTPIAISRPEPEPPTPILEVAQPMAPVLPTSPAESAPPTVATTEEASGETKDELQQEATVSAQVVETLLSKLGFQVQVITRYTTIYNDDGQQSIIVDVSGEDLSPLIGPRGETLNDLEYVARLMAGNIFHKRANFLIDIEGYRERRYEALMALAERMANKALKQNRPVTLEPMPSSDRRIIHITLRDHKDVYTQSTGEGSRRRVRILLK